MVSIVEVEIFGFLQFSNWPDFDQKYVILGLNMLVFLQVTQHCVLVFLREIHHRMLVFLQVTQHCVLVFLREIHHRMLVFLQETHYRALFSYFGKG